MKFLFALLLLFITAQVKAQDFEIKVVSNKYQTVKGQLKKVAAEGIGVEDYKGNYLTFRPSEIVRIKIRKRGLTIGEGAAAGALGGLGVGGLLMSLAEEDSEYGDDLLKLTAVLTVTGAAAGTITGVVAEVVNTKFLLRVNEREENYKAEYKKLEKYVNNAITEHLN